MHTSLNFGDLPSLEQFQQAALLPDPDAPDDETYFPSIGFRFVLLPQDTDLFCAALTLYTENTDERVNFTAAAHKTSHKTLWVFEDPRELYKLVCALTEVDSNPEDKATQWASDILGSMGFEWV